MLLQYAADIESVVRVCVCVPELANKSKYETLKSILRY